jgi:uncharacterized membrane protein
MTKALFGYFWRGCLVAAPVGFTLYFAWLVFSTIDRLLPVGVPGLGFVLTLAIITLIGFLTSNVVGKAVVRETERWLARVPLLKLLYTSIKDLIQAFVGDKKRFDRPVAVALVPGSPAKALGFVTRESMSHIHMKSLVAVYFPQSYNFAGNVLLFPREMVETIDAPTSDVMAFIVSGGVSGFGVGQHEDSLPPSSRAPVAAAPERTLIIEPGKKQP